MRSAHLGAKEKTAREGLKSLVSVDLTDAKIVRDAGKPYAEVTFRLLDAEGRPVPLATKDPADAPWIKNLQLYVNWDAESDFTEMGGKFGAKLEELQPERCNTCHTPEALGKAHGLKR